MNIRDLDRPILKPEPAIHTALTVRDNARMVFSYTTEATALKNAALKAGQQIAKVTNAQENEAAVQAQQEIAGVLSAIEKARKSAKEPVLMFGRQIDDTAKAFAERLKNEQLRLATLVGNFAALEQARFQAAQQAENERLLAIERDRAKQLAAATSLDQIDQIQADFCQKQAEASSVPEPIRADGQRIVKDIEFELVDPMALARAYPQCVRMEPNREQIKAMIKAGIELPGVRWWDVTKAQVRAKPVRPAIEV